MLQEKASVKSKWKQRCNDKNTESYFNYFDSFNINHREDLKKKSLRRTISPTTPNLVVFVITCQTNGMNLQSIRLKNVYHNGRQNFSTNEGIMNKRFVTGATCCS